MKALLACLLSLGAAFAQADGSCLDARSPGPVIHKEVYGQFVEHLGRGVYEGIWVGPQSPIPNTRGIRNDVVAALRRIKVPVVRWPGGCFADDYHWRHGVGPQRQPSINSSWSNAIEPNTFGTHEFMDFIEQIGAQPYVGVNMGSGSVEEAQGWMQYMTAPATTAPGAERARNGRSEPWAVPFVGVGNESWGCGGHMYAEEYANRYRQFQGYLKSYAGPGVRKIATGPDTDDYEWTDTVMRLATRFRPNATSPILYSPPKPLLDGLSLHFYTLPSNRWGGVHPARGFDEAAWISTMKRALLMDELVGKHSAIMDKYDPAKEVALVVDEWGTWYDKEPDGPGGLWQQNTLRDALVAAVTLNVFHAHAERVRMANVAQMVNVLQAMILTDGPRMLVTPTYHVFDLYQVHQDARRLPLTLDVPRYRHGGLDVPAVTGTASVDAAGRTHVSLANLDPTRPHRLTLEVLGLKPGAVKGRVLTAPAMDSFNSFDAPDTVAPRDFHGARWTGSALTVDLPARSVVGLELR
ncbi:alpha-N-arabinofuranosidase [Pelomonas aquatica]|uniref:non-reducing end alpha-L-arabinofuranosidase n=1 Tax=Pelomonas aquatica TaxID=431058 RepID=A0ABU1Z239_9BURK|nr:alpha-L-arabinofuranosidase C-terminal domain-containing protein [Pelomonas aquatica]MDR7294692.1 alpha-N-arabinofuranosidase [Pelomonas aquatica]